MSSKKKIAQYQKQQEEARKKAAAKKLYLTLTIVISLVLIVSTVTTIVAVSMSRRSFTVALEVKDYGTITLEIYPEIAPRSARAFKRYVESGFYDGLKFHRVIEDFMIQGGDPTGTGYGDPTLKNIKGEFSMNGFENDLNFTKGVIGLARGNDYDSATSQFFICHKDAPTLNGYYASFGIVVEGMDIVDAIATCEKNESITDQSGNQYVPAKDVIIERAYIVK